MSAPEKIVQGRQAKLLKQFELLDLLAKTVTQTRAEINEALITLHTRLDKFETRLAALAQRPVFIPYQPPSIPVPRWDSPRWQNPTTCGPSIPCVSVSGAALSRNG